MIPKEDFKIVVQNTPLVSIDFIVKFDDKILLGKRVNKPALGYYFTLGGRVFKNETIKDAQKRIFNNETGLELSNNLKFLGAFEHFYNDSFVDDTISTHYVNLCYEVALANAQKIDLEKLPKEQHNSYLWLTKEELLLSDEVNKYVKDYFNTTGEI